MRSDGFAEMRRFFDDKNQIIREEFFDDASNPVIRSGDYFVREFTYDENGSVTEERYYDIDGTLLNVVDK